MLGFILMLCIIVIFTRLYLNKFDIERKDLISIVISVSLTILLNLIQLLADIILKLIF